MSIKKMLVCFIGMICWCGSVKAAEIDELKTLPALQKIHYSWPVYDEQLIAPTPELKEVFRICRAIPVGSTNSDEAIKAAGAMTRSNGGLKLAVNYSPWPAHRCPTSAPASGEPTMWAEVAYWANRCKEIKVALGIFSASVGAVLIDDERWTGTDNNIIMVPFRNAIYSISKHAFPNAIVEFYGYGYIGPAAGANAQGVVTGWSDGKGLFTLTADEKCSDSYMVSLYCISQEYRSQDSFRKTVAIAGDKPVIPWISLNCGYKPQSDSFHVWTDNWDYGLEWANRFGAQINSPWYWQYPLRYAPWDKATHVCFYPSCPSGGPLKTRLKWITYFIAYCRGAMGNLCVDDLNQ